VKLIPHLYLVPKLKMRGAIPPLPRYDFMTLCLIKQLMHLFGVVLSKAQGHHLYLTLF